MPADARIDAYIDRKADFAKPILRHLRDRINAYCPRAEETMKWNSPAWTYGGEILCMMAAFKAHAVFNLWRGTEVTGAMAQGLDAMGQFGKLTAIDQLPDDAALKVLLERAMALVDSGAKSARVVKHPKSELAVPPEFQTAFDANPAAAKNFAGFAPGQRRDYLEWIIDAKRPETRDKRIAQAIEWIADGKTRNWKYQNC